ncbi:MAG TPA: lipid-A-disaccharide synthase [Vicinamibacterales bacterium]|jgi:lipid-A-disaccharide synthase
MPTRSDAPTVLISCGEPSGDLYAGALTSALRALNPGVRVVGFGGECLRAAGAELVGDYHGLTVTGLVEAIRVLPRSWAMYRRLVRTARDERPDALVAIDFPDFNFRLAAAIRDLGIPIVYYIPPQLWAWRSGRMKTLRRIADRILVIFPFEPEIYRKAGTPATFVGHPLVDLARATTDRRAFLEAHHLLPDAPVVALLPGSRPNEVREILGTLVESLPLIAARVPHAQFVLARAPGLPNDLFSTLSASAWPVAVVEAGTDDVLAASDVAITASGTATVQAAIHECPMVVVYRVAPLSYAIGRRLVHVDTFAMVNLVAGERVAPELIQDGFTAEAVAAETVRLLTDRALRERTVASLREVKERLGGSGATRRAAEIVLETARRR